MWGSNENLCASLCTCLVQARFLQPFWEMIPGAEDKTKLEINTRGPNTPQFWASEYPLKPAGFHAMSKCIHGAAGVAWASFAELVRLAEGWSPADVPSLDSVTHLPPWLRNGSSRA